MHAEIQLAIVLDVHHDVELLHSGQKVQQMMDILLVMLAIVLDVHLEHEEELEAVDCDRPHETVLVVAVVLMAPHQDQGMDPVVDALQVASLLADEPTVHDVEVLHYEMQPVVVSAVQQKCEDPL